MSSGPPADVSPAQSRRELCGAFCVLVIGWVLAHATLVVGVAAYDGTRGPFMPAWRLVVALVLAFVARRTLQGARWAAIFGPAYVLVIAIATFLWTFTGPVWAWLGVAIELGYVFVTWSSLKAFPRPPALEWRRSVRAALVVLFLFVGAESYGHVERLGSERGRRLLVEELNRKYHEAGAREVSMVQRGRELQIVSLKDSDDGIRKAADNFRTEYKALGSTARVWQVGFDEVTVTNGKITAHLPATEFCPETSDAIQRLFRGEH